VGRTASEGGMSESERRPVFHVPARDIPIPTCVSKEVLSDTVRMHGAPGPRRAVRSKEGRSAGQRAI
jgi:hypothetical protein